jgi:predicted dehydrogenase
VLRGRAAVIGTNWGARMHVPALRAGGWFVSALCGRDRGRTRSRAEHLGIPHGVTEIREIAGQSPDLVVCATGWQQRDETLDACLSRGMHAECGPGSRATVLVEHPVRVRPHRREQQREESVRDRSRRRVVVNLPTRFVPGLADLRAWISSVQSEPGAGGGPVRETTTVSHRVVIPHDEERAWTPLLVTHALDAAWHLLGDGRLGGEITGEGVRKPLGTCPSWSWPAFASAGWYTEISAFRLIGRFTASNGRTIEYRLDTIYSDAPAFTDTIVITMGRDRRGTGLVLRRSDEHSPWCASGMAGLPRNTSDEAAHRMLIDAAVAARAESDVWFNAHVEQAKRLRREAQRPGPASFRALGLASASDADIVRGVIETRPGGCASSHGSADSPRLAITRSDWCVA